MRRRFQRLVLGAATLTGLVAVAAGHDFWIEPHPFTVRVGDPVKVGLRVGENFKGELVPRDNEHIARFGLIGPAGDEKPIIGRDGKEPAGYLKLDEPGLYTIVYASKHSSLELPAEKFNKYLETEGLDTPLAVRRQRGQMEQPGRERFSRSVKSLIATPGASRGGFDRVAGLPLEIVPVTDPQTGATGVECKFRILFRDKPLAGVRVTALSRGSQEREAECRADKDGMVSFRLAEQGPWLIACVHMVEAPKDSGADWESFWSSLTFERTGEPSR